MFKVQSLGRSFTEKNPYLWTHVKYVGGSLHAKIQLDSSGRSDTIPAFDARTERQTHDDSIYVVPRGKNKKISYRRGTARRTVTVKTVLNVTDVRRIAFDKSFIGRMTFKVIQSHWKWHE